MSSLIDRVAEAMAGWPMDTAPAEDAQAWRANAQEAIRVMQRERLFGLRDDLVVLFAETLEGVMSADLECHISNAMCLADALLGRYAVEPMTDQNQASVPVDSHG